VYQPYRGRIIHWKDSSAFLDWKVSLTKWKVLKLNPSIKIDVLRRLNIDYRSGCFEISAHAWAYFKKNPEIPRPAGWSDEPPPDRFSLFYFSDNPDAPYEESTDFTTTDDEDRTEDDLLSSESSTCPSEPEVRKWCRYSLPINNNKFYTVCKNVLVKTVPGFSKPDESEPVLGLLEVLDTWLVLGSTKVVELCSSRSERTRLKRAARRVLYSLTPYDLTTIAHGDCRWTLGRASKKERLRGWFFWDKYYRMLHAVVKACQRCC